MTSAEETKSSLLPKDFFEKHRCSRIVLFLVVLWGTSMVIGDGVLTPRMSGMVFAEKFAIMFEFQQTKLQVHFQKKKKKKAPSFLAELY